MYRAVAGACLLCSTKLSLANLHTVAEESIAEVDDDDHTTARNPDESNDGTEVLAGEFPRYRGSVLDTAIGPTSSPATFLIAEPGLNLPYHECALPTSLGICAAISCNCRGCASVSERLDLQEATWNKGKSWGPTRGGAPGGLSSIFFPCVVPLATNQVHLPWKLVIFRGNPQD